MLHDGARDRPRVDALEGAVFLVEDRGQDLAFLVRALEGGGDGGPVVTSGRAFRMSSTFERALARSVWSSRFSTISIPWPATASSMPLSRCAAFSAEKKPTNTAIFPPFGKSSTMRAPRLLPAS